MDAMRQFSTEEAARILHATEPRVRDWARMGGVVPRAGSDGRLQFTFQQLLLLRTTRGLLDAGVSPRRIRRIWSSLRRQVTDDRPLTSIRILADGKRAVAWDGSAPWQPDSGQFLLDFNAEKLGVDAGPSAPLDEAPNAVVSGGAKLEELPIAAVSERGKPEEHHREQAKPEGPAITLLSGRAGPDAAAIAEQEPGDHRGMRVFPIRPRHEHAQGGRLDDPLPDETGEPRLPASELSAEQWFHLGCELESSSPLEARQAYLQAIEVDPEYADAHLNLGRLDHKAGALGSAEARYRRAIECDPQDATAHFNLGVLLEDRQCPHAAADAYARAVECDPDLADAHYNLGLVLDELGRRAEAMQHLIAAHRLYAL